MPYYSNYKRNYKRSYALNKRYRRKQNTYRKWPVPSTKAIVQIPRTVEFNIKNYNVDSANLINIGTSSITSTTFPALADMKSLYDVYRIKSIIVTVYGFSSTSKLQNAICMAAYEKSPVDLSGATLFTDRANLLLEHDKSKVVSLTGAHSSTSLTWINDMQGENADWKSTDQGLSLLGGVQAITDVAAITYSVACVLQFKNRS